MKEKNNVELENLISFVYDKSETKQKELQEESNEYYFENTMFKDEYSVGDKVYYLDEKKEYKVGKIKEIEQDEKGDNLYLITGCQYLRSKEHIYGLNI